MTHAPAATQSASQCNTPAIVSLEEPAGLFWTFLVVDCLGSTALQMLQTELEAANQQLQAQTEEYDEV